MLKISYLSHSCFLLDDGKIKLIIDPFLTGNPNATAQAGDIKVDYIVLTHAHSDHLGDAIPISKANNALIIAVNELANYVASEGCIAHNMHIGGGRDFDFGRLQFTQALHGSVNNSGDYMGSPAGVIINMGGKTIYHAGDTGLFYDMKMLGEINKIDIAMLPIGDNFTMGIDDAVYAVEFLNPKLAVPMHYNTFGVIKADPKKFKSKVEAKGKQCKVFEYGETCEF
ncbi:MAG: metal-dependent hydrolase [Candidatus Kapabacteria bacterium]|nr:metal-dependent hydrolase [Candidatus Kapabacteria bacterium]